MDLRNLGKHLNFLKHAKYCPLTFTWKKDLMKTDHLFTLYQDFLYSCKERHTQR